MGVLYNRLQQSKVQYYSIVECSTIVQYISVVYSTGKYSRVSRLEEYTVQKSSVEQNRIQYSMQCTEAQHAVQQHRVGQHRELSIEWSSIVQQSNVAQSRAEHSRVQYCEVEQIGIQQGRMTNAFILEVQLHTVKQVITEPAIVLSGQQCVGDVLVKHWPRNLQCNGGLSPDALADKLVNDLVGSDSLPSPKYLHLSVKIHQHPRTHSNWETI